MSRCHLVTNKEVSKITALKVTQKLWLHILVAAFISLPIMSVMGQAAHAGYTANPDDSAGTSDSSYSRTRSTR